MAIRHCIGERTLGDRGPSATHAHLTSGERAVHEAENIFRGERLDVGAVLEDITYTEPTCADIFLNPLRRGGPILDGSRGEIDMSDVASKGPGVHDSMIS